MKPYISAGPSQKLSRPSRQGLTTAGPRSVEGYGVACHQFLDCRAGRDHFAGRFGTQHDRQI